MRKAKPTQVVARNAPVSLFPFADSSGKTRGRKAQCKLYELQCEMEKLKIEAEDDSEGSDVAENFCRSKPRALYQEFPIKPETFSTKIFNRWKLWVKYYKSVVKANGWSDMEAIEGIPACLKSWAVEEFETVLRHYVERVLGEKTPHCDMLLAVLETKMQQYCRKRAELSYFKAVANGRRRLERFFRRVRYLEDWHFQENHFQRETRIYAIR